MPLQRSCAVLTFVGYAFYFYPFGIISGGDRHFVGGAPGSGNAGAANGLEFDVIAAVVSAVRRFPAVAARCSVRCLASGDYANR